MQLDINDFLDKNNVYAVIGASKDPNKYGYKVFVDLLKKNREVVPINPNAKEIYGKKAYASVDELDNVDILIFVVPPKITNNILVGLKKQYKGAWFQPGSSNEQTKKICEKIGLPYIADTCIMIKTLGD